MLRRLRLIRDWRDGNNMDCLQCGKCCIELGQDQMIISNLDVARWINEDRFDILYMIDPCLKVQGGSTKYNSCGELLDDTLKQCSNCGGGDIENPHYSSRRCVFLRKTKGMPFYKCKIQETKPNHCKNWPVGKHTNCETKKSQGLK